MDFYEKTRIDPDAFRDAVEALELHKPAKYEAFTQDLSAVYGNSHVMRGYSRSTIRNMVAANKDWPTSLPVSFNGALLDGVSVTDTQVGTIRASNPRSMDDVIVTASEPELSSNEENVAALNLDTGQSEIPTISQQISEAEFVDLSLHTADRLQTFLGSQSRIDVSINILLSCYSSAAHSFPSSLSDTGGSVYASASEYLYWLVKLKPFSLSDYGKAGALGSQINEIVGYYIAVTMIDLKQSYQLNQLMSRSTTLATKQQEFREQNFERAMRLEARIIQNLSNNNFSAPALSLLLESLFGIPSDSDTATVAKSAPTRSESTARVFESLVAAMRYG